MSNILTETVTLFEWRLEQLEFLLRDPNSSSNEDEATAAAPQDVNGHDRDSETPSIIERLSRLEHRFNEICSNSSVATDLLKLHERLDPVLGSKTDDEDSDLTTEHKIPVILAAEDQLRSKASQLATLNETPFPEAKDLADVIALRSRIMKARQVQQEQAQAVEELRARTVELMARWYRSSILHGGGKWNEIEQRLLQVELTVRREAAARSRKENEI